jgi:hypothetical protein
LGFIKGLFLIGFIILNALFQNDEVISWEKSRKLTWEDFKDEPQNDRAAAVTASGITYEFSTNKMNGKIVDVNFKVSTYFYPHKSWFRPEVCDALILGHEQLHFDITEVFARKFIKLLATIKITTNIKNEVSEIYRNINKELNDYQNLYDTDTNFSRNSDQQKDWEKKVTNLLKN